MFFEANLYAVFGINVTIQPYHDDQENLKWLFCRVISVNPFLIEYYVYTETTTDATVDDRIVNDFYSFSLDALYRPHGVEEFSKQKIGVY